MEYKSFAFDIDEVTEAGQFQGYAATFGNIDLGNDVLAPGAFTQSLKDTLGGRVPILDHHSPDRQIGWNLSAREDQHGLFVFGQLDLNVQIARERHSLMKLADKLGAQTGLSIGFQVEDESPDAEDPRVRHLLKVSLMEYSIVTFPMNTQARVLGVKSEDEVLASLHSLNHSFHFEFPFPVTKETTHAGY